MSLTLNWDLSDPAKVCRTFNQIKVFRSATAGGVFIEVSAPGTRPELRPDIARYSFTDSTGTSDYFYSSSYYHSQTRAESSRTEPQRGQGDPSYSIISPHQIRDEYLFGMKLADRQGNPLPEAVYQRAIRTGAAYVERQLGFCLLPKVVVDEDHPYRIDRQGAYLLVHVDHLPIASIQGMALRFPGRATDAYSIRTSDITFSQWEGGIEVVPGAQSGTSPFLSTFWQQLWQSPNLAWRNYIPGAVRLSYTAGFASGKVPADLADLVAKSAAVHVLNVAGDILGPPGISSSSIGLDGLSQSVGRIASQTGNAYSSRSSQYMTALQEDLPRLKQHYMGIRLRVA